MEMAVAKMVMEMIFEGMEMVVAEMVMVIEEYVCVDMTCVCVCVFINNKTLNSKP